MSKAEIIQPPSDTSSFFLALPSSVKQLISGGISGGLARTLTAPFERTIILQQTKNPHYGEMKVHKILLTIGQKEGFKGYFKGNGTNVMRIVPFSGVELFTFELYKRQLFQLFGETSQTKNKVYFAAGAGAGLTAAAVVYPLDLVRTLFAFQTDKNAPQTIFRAWKNIVSEHGFRGLYKGLGATMIGITPYASLKLTFFQLLKNAYQSYDVKNKDLASLVSGAIAGCAAVTVTYPTDLVRRRFQIRVLQNNAENISYVSLIKDIVRKDGVKGLYKGLGATYLKLMPSTAITFMVNEKLKRSWGVY